MVTTNGTTVKRVAFLLEQQFEDSEFQIPYTALKQAGATTVILGSRMNDEYQGKRGQVTARPDATATEVSAEDFDAIVIPGGNAPDHIRTNPNAVRLVIDAMAQNMLVAAVCHGPQVLIEADQLRGRQATGFRAIRKDMQNANATYVDEAVVIDGNLITARQPGDLPIFATALLNQLGLSIAGMTLPSTSDRTVEWWQLAERWGGSSRQEILNAINTALLGELYTMATFKHYREQLRDSELIFALRDIVASKELHIEQLTQRLRDFGETVTWQGIGSDALATLQGWLQSNEEIAILRRALGDIQTGVVDAFHLSTQITDPRTVELFFDIEATLSRQEQYLVHLYRARVGRNVQPPTPTTVAVS